MVIGGLPVDGETFPRYDLRERPYRETLCGTSLRLESMMKSVRGLCSAWLFLCVFACGDKDTVCDGSEKGCDGNVLQECVDGDWEETDCEAEAMICHDMGDESHCMAEDMGM